MSIKHAEARRRVVDLCLDLAQRGFLAGTGGNVALRIDAEHFAVTPSATDYHAMSAGDVSVMRLSDLRQVEGERPPSVESSLHARVLRARRDCDCSVHTHQPVASACALLGEPLRVEDAAARALLGPQIAVVGYAPSGTAWLATRLAHALRPDINGYLMRNHGVLCCGRDAPTAVRAVEALEAVAARHLRARIEERCASDPSRRPALQRVLDLLAAFNPGTSSVCP
jgi:L-fuculose-phosphate aldolase